MSACQTCVPRAACCVWPSWQHKCDPYGPRVIFSLTCLENRVTWGNPLYNNSADNYSECQNFSFFKIWLVGWLADAVVCCHVGAPTSSTAVLELHWYLWSKYQVLWNTTNHSPHEHFCIKPGDIKLWRNLILTKPHCFHSVGNNTYEKQVFDSCTFCCAKLHDFILYFPYNNNNNNNNNNLNNKLQIDTRWQWSIYILPVDKHGLWRLISIELVGEGYMGSM
jgi:hypothetical protein